MGKIQLNESYFRNEGKRPLIDEYHTMVPKSMSGFLGAVKSNTGRTMTEFSVDVEVKQPDGSVKEMRVPSLVPGLTQNDINLLAKDEELMESPENVRMAFRERNKDKFNKIFNLASKHAEKRLKQNKSVFYQDDEPTSKVIKNNDKRPLLNKYNTGE